MMKNFTQLALTICLLSTVSCASQMIKSQSNSLAIPHETCGKKYCATFSTKKNGLGALKITNAKDKSELTDEVKLEMHYEHPLRHSSRLDYKGRSSKGNHSAPLMKHKHDWEFSIEECVKEGCKYHLTIDSKLGSEQFEYFYSPDLELK